MFCRVFVNSYFYSLGQGLPSCILIYFSLEGSFLAKKFFDRSNFLAKKGCSKEVAIIMPERK